MSQRKIICFWWIEPPAPKNKRGRTPIFIYSVIQAALYLSWVDLIEIQNLDISTLFIRLFVLHQSKMKLFQTLQRNLLLVKFHPNQTNSFFGLIRQHSSCFSQSSMSIASLTLYLLHDASSVKEYMDSMFLTMAAITIFVSFSNTVFKTPELYTFLNSIEKAGNNSELINAFEVYWFNWNKF